MLNEKMKFMRKQNVIYFIYIGLIQVVTCIDITIKGSKQYYVAGEPFNFTCRFNSTANAVRALQKDNVQVQSVQLAAGVCYNVQPTVPVICTASFCSCSQQGDIFTASWTFPISSTNTWKCVEGARQSPEVTLISAVPCSITVTQTPDTAIIGNAITLTCVTNECRPTASIQWLIGNTNYTRNSTVTVTYSADNLTKVESKLILIATTDLIDKIVSCRAWDIDNTVDVIKNFTLNIQDVETTTAASTITDTTITSRSQTTTELLTTSTESLTTTQPETTSTDSVSTTSKSVTTSTESLTTTQPETTSTDSVSTTSKSETTSTDSLTTTQPETTSTDSVSTTSKSETTTRSYTGKIVTEGDLTTNQPTTTPVADGSSVMTTVGHTSNTKLSGLSRDEIIAIGSIVGFFIILFIVAIVTYMVYTRIRNNKNTKDERENQEHYHKHQGQINRHEYRYNDYNTRGYLYGEVYNIKQGRGERYRAQGGDPNKRQKMMTTRSYTTYQKPRGHDYNHYKSANTVSTYYPRMYGESHNYGFDMEMSPYIESFQYYTGSTHGSTHGSYYNHQNPEHSGGRHHGRYQGRQGQSYPATSNYYYPNGQHYYQYQQF